ncbi:putative pyoverdine/dityrosine biosynthesis protein [Phyllosticta citribraziliensis]|uniref:Pyoverdine/dityrosine biosynthesis protein n=1 Tax=Phyllosticta citribraziliensis TaxID=989973 RepID=A0ABR1LJV0_9PEZI
MALHNKGLSQVADSVLSVIESYRLRASPFEPKTVQDARDTFLPYLTSTVQAEQPIVLVLPAFPFKSPNSKDKVLGALPDKAEEVSLLHLQSLCNNIKDVYAPGAELWIVSDGIVYNDLLGVPDETVYTFGETLRTMAKDLGCSSIKFARLSQMPSLEKNLPIEMLEYSDSRSYERIAPLVRQSLVSAFGSADHDVDKDIASNPDIRATYMGYLKYLSHDLKKNELDSGEVSESSASSTASSDSEVPKTSRKSFKRHVSRVAKSMIYRGKCYAACVQQWYPNAVRLSIHAANSSTKIPISVIPSTNGRPITPWHSTMVCRLDGTFQPMTRSEAEACSDLELIYRDGQPWCFREKSSLYDIPNTTIEHVYPCGLLIKAAKGTHISDVDIMKVRQLAERNSPVVLRDFDGTTDRPTFVDTGRKMGPIMKWKFGELLEVKDGGDNTRGLNNVLSTEPMPMHYDGLFKMVNGVSTPPNFQMFTAPTASPKGLGRTLFAHSKLVFQYLAEPYTADSLRGRTWRVETHSFDESHFGNLPLIVDHPKTKEPCIRYHEDWPQERTAFEPTRIHIEDAPPAEDDSIREAIERVLYDWRVCLRMEWEQGDLLVSDNILMMHTREGYKASFPRELWRLHID